MFLAEAQSRIRRLPLPRTSLTLFCLFLAAVAQVNHCAALLAIAERLPRAAAHLLSARCVNKAPRHVWVVEGGTRGQRSHGYTSPGPVKGRGDEEHRLQTGKGGFEMSGKP